MSVEALVVAEGMDVLPFWVEALWCVGFAWGALELCESAWCEQVTSPETVFIGRSVVAFLSSRDETNRRMFIELLLYFESCFRRAGQLFYLGSSATK